MYAVLPIEYEHGSNLQFSKQIEYVFVPLSHSNSKLYYVNETKRNSTTQYVYVHSIHNML